MAEGTTPIMSMAADDQFADIKPALDRKRALVESSRCYFCHDAPCVEACPTGIDIPNFIRMISTDNVRGAAVKIFEQNILGGMCARVCPTEILCEQACVRNHSEDKPVSIGALQRYATDQFMAREPQPFSRASASGKRVAVVGAGPAGLSCAHRLAMLGHDVALFEARPKLGGLNEYGIAAYKTVDNFAQREVDFILGIGGITPHVGRMLGRDFTLTQIRRDHDAVFLAVGLAGVKALGLEGENWQGVMDAVAFIAELRQAPDKARLAIGRSVVVIGGGNTAIDIAVQSKRLGARDVTLVYRRGAEHMSATGHEQEFARLNGVTVKLWAQPKRLLGEGGRVTGIEFEYTELDEQGRLLGTGDTFTLVADQIFKAIGQQLVPDPLHAEAQEILAVAHGKLAVNENGETSLRGVFAGGDCTAQGQDLTVQAVEEGKRAAQAIDAYLRGEK
ncbi:MAG TPA: NAD(P)-dependent oxidoreductase [Dongiaceae bacterium]|jgi:glutamate synthase (NADPH/NADH) small chain|nr:NAD(P)-dependent oxidoreductase [Dongiaceae bacterium]